MSEKNREWREQESGESDERCEVIGFIKKPATISQHINSTKRPNSPCWAVGLVPSDGQRCVSRFSPGDEFRPRRPVPTSHGHASNHEGVGPYIGMGGSVEQGARRYVEAADFGEQASGYFYATAHRTKAVGPMDVQIWPEYLVHEPSQKAGFNAIVQLTGVGLSEQPQARA